MTIVHIVAVYPPYRGGLGQVVHEEAIRLARRGHEVHVLTLAEPGCNTQVSEEEGVQVHRVRPFMRYGKAGYVRGVRRRITEMAPDIMHVHVPFFGLQEGLFLALLRGWQLPYVVTYHMDIVAKGAVRWIAQISRRLVLPTIMLRARAVLVSSMDYAQSSWIQRFLDRVRVIDLPFGVDVERFAPSERSEEAKVTQLLFVGGLGENHYFKGVEQLIKAMDALAERTDWQLTIVGDGGLRPRYEAQVRAAGLADRVTFAGRVSEEALPSYFQMADVHIFPSVDRSEAFGLVALEAQASGVPVIASNLDGVRTVVEDGVTGLLVEPSNVTELTRAILQLLEDPAQRRRMGVAARERAVSQFTWERHVDGLETAYKEAL